jgi:hypothetical protein
MLMPAQIRFKMSPDGSIGSFVFNGLGISNKMIFNAKIPTANQRMVKYNSGALELAGECLFIF